MGPVPQQETGERVIASRYELGGLLGRGGMGQVWRAEDTLLSRPVAVKEITVPDALPEDERERTRRKVMREARAAARLAHQRSVTVFDVVEDAGRIFIVMELVDAPTLSALVRDQGTMAPARAAAIGAQVLDVLEAAHAEGIVHRDIKPGNVLIAAGDNVKVTDFGIASVLDDPSVTISTDGVVGSPSYMSPEQARSEGSDPATDLWGLGATLYFAVEGQRPFDRGQAVATLHAVVTEDLPPMRNAGPLEPVIRSLMAKDPADRPTAAEARRMLEGVAGRESGTQTAVLAAAAPAAAPAPPPPRTIATAPATPPPPPVPPGPGRRTPWALIGALVVVLLFAGAVAAGVLLNDDDGGDGTDVASDEPPVTEAPAAADAEGEETTTTTAAPTTTTAEATEEEDEAPPPEGGGGTYTHPRLGYTVELPDGWTAPNGGGNTIDIQAPDGGYLRIGHTPRPGDDAVAAWEAQERAFRAEHPDYQRISLEEVDYNGWEAALWEFTFEGQHAYNLGFVVSDDQGYALNLVVPEDQWDASQPAWEQVRDSFEPRD